MTYPALRRPHNEIEDIARASFSKHFFMRMLENRCQVSIVR